MSPIGKARWELLSPLLDELLPLDAPARAERIAQVRREDSALAEHLQALLEREARIEQSGFLDKPAPLP